MAAAEWGYKMPTLDPKQTKTPQELRRLAALANVGTTQLVELTGLGERAINKYLSDTSNNSNYLFQFALEFLAEQEINKIQQMKEIKK